MPDSPQFKECIATRLSRISRLIDDIYRHHLKKTGLSESQMTILLTLSEEEALPQIQLGKILHLQRSTVTRNLDRLVTKGLIDKKGSAVRPTLHLTTAGKRMVKKVKPVWAEAMKEASQLIGSSGLAAIGILERRLLKDN